MAKEISLAGKLDKMDALANGTDWRKYSDDLAFIDAHRALKKELAWEKLFLVQAVKLHAQANYEVGGWDYVVEAYEDYEIASVIRWCETEKGAIAKMAKEIGPRAAMRAEVRSLAF
jgi:hypothetical protein